MKKLMQLLKKIDDNLIRYMVYLSIVLIPLYPKIPIKPISYTYIAFRVDDVFIALFFLIFVIQSLRRKITFNKLFFPLFILFWIAVFSSLGWGIFIQKTLAYRQLAFLNAARRVQYMFLFFAAFSTVRKKEDFYSYFKLFYIVLVLVCLYGIGQKLFNFPAIQTMNPVYSQGKLLFLTAEARISSTFAGHYDLAAYLVLFIPLVIGWFHLKKNFWYIIIFILSLYSLILTASRISFISYVISTAALLIFLKKPKFIVFALILTIAFTYLSKNLKTRFFESVQIKQLYVNQKTGQVEVPQVISSKNLPAGTFYVKIDQTVSDANTKINERLVYNKVLHDIQDNASKAGVLLSTKDAELQASSVSAGLTPVNTVVSDISAATRFQVEWPRAIKAFLTNPIFGTGPSSITESTDNDYLRSIGEFGLFGTIAFALIIFNITKLVWTKAKSLPMSNPERYVFYGFLFGLFGLLINASYIDVFEASKIAYIFWLMTGILTGYILLENQSNKQRVHQKS